MPESMKDIAQRRAAELAGGSTATRSTGAETSIPKLRQLAQERAARFASPTVVGETEVSGPTIVAEAAEESASPSVTEEPVHPAEGGTRPRRGPLVVWGRRAFGVFVAWNILNLTGKAIFGGFRQEEVDPRANPWPYGRGVVLAFGDQQSKLTMLNQFDKYIGDCNVGRPFGVPGAPDEEFQYARPLWNVYKYVEENRAADLRNWAVRARIGAQLHGNDLETRVPALSSAMAAESDPYLKIDIFVGQIANGLPTDAETMRKVQAVKAMLWQGETNRQRTPFWGKLPEDYSVLPSGALVCQLGEGEQGMVIAQNDGKKVASAQPKSKMEFRRAYTNTRDNLARRNNNRG